MCKKVKIPKQKMPTELPKEWLEEIGINKETGMAYHYVNELANVLMSLDMIIGQEWHASQKDKARKTLPHQLLKMLSYKQFLSDQIDRHNKNVQHRVNKDYIDPRVVEKIIQPGSRAQITEEKILKMKDMGFMGGLLILETLKDLLVEVSYLLAGDKGEMAMKKRLKMST